MSDQNQTSNPSSTPGNTSSPEGQDQNNQPISTEGQAAAPKPKAKVPTYHKFKVGDEEVALTQADIERDYKKYKGADQRFREASAKEKAMQDFMEALANDPEKILSDKRLPINKKALAERWLVEQIEAELADPRETELQARERKVKEWEEAQAKALKDQQEAEEAETKAQAIQQRKTEISKTLAAAMEMTTLSKHPESAAATLREMAAYTRAARERGETVTPEELANHIEDNRLHQMYLLTNSMEGEDLINFLGEEIVNRIRKHDLSRLHASRQGGQVQQHRTPVRPRNDSGDTREFMDPSDWRMKLRDRK